jgi:hypothetical protein
LEDILMYLMCSRKTVYVVLGLLTWIKSLWLKVWM